MLSPELKKLKQQLEAGEKNIMLDSDKLLYELRGLLRYFSTKSKNLHIKCRFFFTLKIQQTYKWFTKSYCNFIGIITHDTPNNSIYQLMCLYSPSFRTL